jgi:hypothetical protein
MYILPAVREDQSYEQSGDGVEQDGRICGSRTEKLYSLRSWDCLTLKVSIWHYLLVLYLHILFKSLLRYRPHFLGPLKAASIMIEFGVLRGKRGFYILDIGREA